MTKLNTEILQIRLSKELKNKLRSMEIITGMNMSNIVKMALNLYFKSNNM